LFIAETPIPKAHNLNDQFNCFSGRGCIRVYGNKAHRTEYRRYFISLYTVGTEYTLRAMKVNNSKFRKALESGTTVYDAVKFLTKYDLKALTWYGVNLAKRVTLQLETPDVIMDVQDGIGRWS
jgi:hypothetical protein